MAMSDAGAPRPRRLALKVLGVIGGLLVVVAVGLFIYANVATEAANLPESVSAESRERNTVIATSLVVGGIEESFVDVTPERVYVTYALPNSTDADGGPDPFFQEFVLGAAARGAPDSARVVVVQHVNGAARLMWVVETAKVTSFLAGEITEEALRAAIEATTYPPPAA